MEDKRNEQRKQWWETHKGELEKKPASNAYNELAQKIVDEKKPTPPLAEHLE